MSAVGSGMTAEQQSQLTASFNEFILRPENRALTEQAGQEEAQAALEAADAALHADFLDKVQQAGPQAAALLEPYLRSPVLRRIVMSLANDPHTNLATWVQNAQVQALLNQAVHHLMSGRVTEQEMEHMLLSALKSPTNPHSTDFKKLIQTKITLNTEQLVAALNEHLAERRAAAAALRAGRAEDALAAAKRALSIVRIIQGSTEEDQEHVAQNTVGSLLDVAEAAIAAQQFGCAVESCTEALQLGGSDSVRGLLLRARAHVWRREYKAAQVDLAAAQQVDPGESESSVRQLTQLVQQLRQQDKAKDAQLFKRMFR